MATVSLDVPPAIHVEIPAHTRWAELNEQPQRGKVDRNTSDFDVNDPVWPVTQDIATERARLVGAYYGTVPAGMSHAIVGAPEDEAGQTLAKIVFNRARDTVQTERYGPKSFIQRFIRGKLSTLNVKVLITNWMLDACICQFEVEGEGEAGIANRDANRAVYEQGIADLQQLWEREYTHAWKSADSTAVGARGLNKKRLERARELYRVMKDAPPVFDIDPPNGSPYWESALECEQAKLVPFMNRAKADRLRKYEEYFTKDMVASHYSTIMNIVDIRRLAENANIDGVPQFWSMIVNQWSHTCDLVLRHVTDPQLGIRRELLMIDPSLRAAAYHYWSDRSLECFQHIRRLFNRLGYNVGYGEWKDIPILSVGHRGRKRARTDE
ncbi:hypothetical protein J4E90_007596 [Alternaria incomplexa]|uniref:uncharacterized protein n=1 Tax=Alternaria incomplexa TaxID=1187928 RepID=UPI00221E50D3|nr:uncharacterized protein J4E90_007596 [Alternaria incomplexa]KAI4910165.1 hypothetical protein J4E90_007596 [Alternaria incomplexa]